MKHVLSRNTREVVLVLLNDYCADEHKPGPVSLKRIVKANTIARATWATLLLTSGTRRGKKWKEYFDNDTFAYAVAKHLEVKMGCVRLVAQNDDRSINNTIGEIRKAILMIDASAPNPRDVTLTLVSNSWHLRRALVAMYCLYPELMATGPHIRKVKSIDKPQYLREILCSWPLLIFKILYSRIRKLL